MKPFSPAIRFAIAALLVSLLASCSNTEDIAYIHDAERGKAEQLSGTFACGIQPNDKLYIYVESAESGVTVPFNEETNKIAMKDGAVLNASSSHLNVQGYMVTPNGEITFPMLGKLYVQGLTHDELARAIEQRLIHDGHIKDPVVTVKLMNFKVNILGDVAKPGQLTIDGERVTIFEALSMAGDLTIYGQRRNVTVIREENGVRTVGEVDLSSKEIFKSPYYYLHQNDVVYVEPNLRKKRNAERDPMTITYISSAVSIISMLSSVAYQLIMSKYYSNR